MEMDLQEVMEKLAKNRKNSLCVFNMSIQDAWDNAQNHLTRTAVYTTMKLQRICGAAARFSQSRAAPSACNLCGVRMRRGFAMGIRF